MKTTPINLFVPPTAPQSAEITVRHARIADVPQMIGLINSYASQGLMLPKSATQLYNHLRDFVVAEAEGQIVGSAGLKITWADLAEIISLAVAPGFQGKGIGRRLVEPLIEDARALEIPVVFALTYQTEFFSRLGFHVVPKETLSQKVWQDCVQCPKQHCCDEIAMIREVLPSGAGSGAPPASGYPTASGNGLLSTDDPLTRVPRNGLNHPQAGTRS